MIINYTGTFKPFQKVAEWINHFDPLAKYLELDPYDSTIVRHGDAKKGSQISYVYGDYCLYNNKIYRCIVQSVNINTSFTESSWELVTNLFDELSKKPGIKIFTNTGAVTGVLNPDYNLYGESYSLANNNSYGSVIEGNNNKVGSYYTHAEGQNTYATGYYAHTEGYGTTAGSYSHAEGEQTYAMGSASHAEGEYSRAIQNCSHAEGQNTYASGYSSHTEGCYSSACSDSAHAEGRYTKAGGMGSHAEGYYTYAEGYDGTHAEGYNTYASSASSHAEGKYTKATGEAAHAEGYQTCASGYVSHVEGYNCISANSEAHTEGYANYNYGNFSHVEGAWNNCNNSGSAIHIEGAYNLAPTMNASGSYLHIEGSNNTGHSYAAHIEGQNNLEKNADQSHVGGYYSSGFGKASFTHGQYCQTKNVNEVAFGNYNNTIDNGTNYQDYNASSAYYYYEGATTTVKYDGKIYQIAQTTPNPAGTFDPQYWTEIGTYEAHGTVFTIGNGTDASHRSNIFEIMDTGVAKLDNHTVVTDVKVPDCPTTTSGNFALVCTVANGTPTYQWVAINNNGTINITPPVLTHGGTISLEPGYWHYDTDPVTGAGSNWSDSSSGPCDGRCGVPNCGVTDSYTFVGTGWNEDNGDGTFTPHPGYRDNTLYHNWTKNVPLS